MSSISLSKRRVLAIEVATAFRNEPRLTWIRSQVERWQIQHHESGEPGGTLLPFQERSYSLEDKCALLAALVKAFGGGEPLRVVVADSVFNVPYGTLEEDPAVEQFNAALPYISTVALWKEAECKLTDDDEVWLRSFFEDVLAAAPPQPAVDTKPSDEPPKTVMPKRSSHPTEAALVQIPQDSEGSLLPLLNVFTNGVADERIRQAHAVLKDVMLSTQEKLTKIDAAIRIPSTASAEKLGNLLGKTKQAVMKTDWWKQNRRGEKTNEVGRRHIAHNERRKSIAPPPSSDRKDDDER